MEQPQENNTSSSNLMWIVLAGLVVIGLAVWGWSYVQNNPGVWSGMAGEENTTEVDNSDLSSEEQARLDDEERGVPQNAQEEQERIERIQSEREALLAEQARLEAQANSTSTEDQQASAERQQEIEGELLELQNEEEYPPLPNPGT